MTKFSKGATGAVFGRRRFLATGALAGTAVVSAPSLLRASTGDLKIGWLRPLTGPLASSFESLYAAGDIALD